MAQKPEKDLLFPPREITRALEIRCSFMNLGLAPGIEEVFTRGVLEQHLPWCKEEVFLGCLRPSSVYLMTEWDLPLSYYWLGFVRQFMQHELSWLLSSEELRSGLLLLLEWNVAFFAEWWYFYYLSSAACVSWKDLWQHAQNAVLFITSVIFFSMNVLQLRLPLQH